MGAWNGILLALLGLLAVAFLVTGLGWVDIASFLGEEVSEKNAVLSFIGVAMGGTLLAINAVASHRRAKAMEWAAKAQADGMKAQAAANQQTERGRQQERFKNAIEHLGHESAAVRLGGRYDLFNLAKETAELRQTVLDIFCTHIRQATSEDDYREQHRTRPSLEIQDLLVLIFVREPDVFEGLRVDLEDSWLQGADLRKARLWNANLRSARLYKALLCDARLERATLVQADLRGALLCGASLREANLRDARMEACNLHGAKLQGAVLCTAILTAAWLKDAVLQGADLSVASMFGAIQWDAHMQASALSQTYLMGTTFDGARLQGVRSTGWPESSTFEDRVRGSIGAESDPSGIYSGGLTRSRVNQVVEDIAAIDGDKADGLRAQLREYIDKPLAMGLPANNKGVTGSYTAEEAEKWIKEHTSAMSEIPEAATAAD